ncbi:Mevalonate kinase [Maudiozyma exigua]|uniref:Mevalonate kinase n=1 Tax=Maudiozyma exigua TaxID=34358 RepID=A0A9P6WEQ1_MAUEX|nr:Mevalonate kinase [Kazachstania exigua]
MFVTSAPGKVIIFGEHSAVYYKPAIAAAASSLRSYLLIETENITTNVLQLSFPNLKFQHKWSIENLSQLTDTHSLQSKTLSQSLLQTIDTALLSDIVNPLHKSAAQCFLYLYLSIIPPMHRSSLKCTLISTLPVGAGLGSSASVSVVLSQAFLKLAQCTLSPTLINEWAYVGEMVMHGKPSGIDNTIATYGGALQFIKDDPQNTKELFPKKPIVAILTYTRIPRSTKTLVSNVRVLYESMPEIVEPILDSMAHVALKGGDALQEAKLDDVLQLVRINHGLLVSLGVSHPGLEIIRNLTTELQVGETKLTGAGGGGCALTFLNNSASEQDVAQFRDTLNQRYDYQTFETTLGGIGCSLLDLNQITNKEQISAILDLFNSQNASMEQIDNNLLPGGPADLPWKI